MLTIAKKAARLLQNSFGFPVTFLGVLFGLSHTCFRPIGLLQEAYQALSSFICSLSLRHGHNDPRESV
jgi:hypothetical protein